MLATEFPSLGHLDANRREAELRRLAEIHATVFTKDEPKPIGPQLIAEYLSGVRRQELMKRYGLGPNKVARIIHAGTTREERRARHALRKCQENQIHDKRKRKRTCSPPRIHIPEIWKRFASEYFAVRKLGVDKEQARWCALRQVESEWLAHEAETESGEVWLFTEGHWLNVWRVRTAWYVSVFPFAVTWQLARFMPYRRLLVSFAGKCEAIEAGAMVAARKRGFGD